ncbi:MAG: cytochrome c-type biogenesis protein [Pseudomonadota bacterium]
MQLLSKLTAIILALSLGWPALAAIETYTFETPEQEQAYKKLTEELRCLVCQNQNIADSNAELAQDLRKKAYEQVKQGKSSNEVMEWMVDRYGDFVLYRPPVRATTLFLWVGPLIFLLIAFVVLWRIGRARRSKSADSQTVDAASLEQARHLLEEREP